MWTWTRNLCRNIFHPQAKFLIMWIGFRTWKFTKRRWIGRTFRVFMSTILKPLVPWPQEWWMIPMGSSGTFFTPYSCSQLWIKNNIINCWVSSRRDHLDKPLSKLWRLEWQIKLTHTQTHHISCCHHLTHHQKLFIMDTSIMSQGLSLNLSVCCCTTSYYTDSQVAEPFTYSEREKREMEISVREGERERTLVVWSAEAIFLWRTCTDGRKPLKLQAGAHNRRIGNKRGWFQKYFSWTTVRHTATAFLPSPYQPPLSL